MANKRRAAIYARYSSHNQREKSIEDQVAEAREVAEKNGLIVVNVYADRAMTGKNDNRPGFQDMLRDAAAGLFDIIILWKRDRFARNRYDAAINKKKLEQAGVDLLYTAEPTIKGPDGVIIDSTLEGFSEYYSLALSVNVSRGMKRNAQKSKFLGSRPPFGYAVDADKNFIVDETAAPFAVDAFIMYADGVRLTDISDYLFKSGFVNPDGNKFSVRNLSCMFENKKYIGVYEYKINGEFISVPGGIPAIVPADLWDKCQKKKNEYRKAPHSCDDYALTSLLFCGVCGCTFNGTNILIRGKERYQYYRHSSNEKEKNCIHRNFRRDALENAVFDLIFKEFLSDKNIKRISDAATAEKESEKTSGKEKALKRQKAAVEKSIKNLMKAIESGIITPTTKDRLQELENQKAAIDFEMSKASIVIEKPVIDVVGFLNNIKAGIIDDPVWRKETARVLIKNILLYPDRADVYFNLDGANPYSIKL